MAILTEDKKDRLDKIIEKFDVHNAQLLMLLKETQKEFDESLNNEVLDYIAKKIDRPLSELYGVATFYSLFSTKPRGKYIIRICESPPCHLMGSDSVIDFVKDELDIQVGETTKDKKFTLETTSCLGICAVAPAMMINDEMHGNLTPGKIREILANLP